MHLQQKQFFYFDTFFRLVQLRRHQSKHLSQTMHFLLTIALEHVKQYHCIFSILASKINAFPRQSYRNTFQLDIYQCCLNRDLYLEYL